MSSLEKAIEIAATAHEGQKDKSGAPYILHPLRLMMRMDSETAKIVAVLHDVVEDSKPDDKWTFDRLRENGFAKHVIDAVDGVTSRTDESYDAFIDRAAANPISRQVKLADLEDNMNLLRLGEIRRKDLARIEKYHIAWKRLSSNN